MDQKTCINSIISALYFFDYAVYIITIFITDEVRKSRHEYEVPPDVNPSPNSEGMQID